MQHSRTFAVRLKKDPDSGWFAIRCVELPEATSKGKTEEQALKNIKEAIELVLSEYEEQARKEGGRLPEQDRNSKSLPQSSSNPVFVRRKF